MPLYRHNGEFFYFAHVPKCGGKSVEAYLGERWGKAAFLDNFYYGKVKTQRWLRASPQHATWEDFSLVIPPDWISASFAVVRHPLTRLVSEYNYLSQVRQVLPKGMDFPMWLDELRQVMRKRPYSYDNHIRPQVEFIPPDARVFRLEEGLDLMIPYLDELSGDRNGPREIGRLHQTSDHSQRKTRAETVDQGVAGAYVNDFYAADLQRFGYAPTVPQDLTAYVPVSRATVRKPLFSRSRLARRLAYYLDRKIET